MSQVIRNTLSAPGNNLRTEKDYYSGQLRPKTGKSAILVQKQPAISNKSCFDFLTSE